MPLLESRQDWRVLAPADIDAIWRPKLYFYKARSIDNVNGVCVGSPQSNAGP